MRMSWGTANRLEAALKANNKLTTFRDQVANSPGFPEAYLLNMGLTKSDLLRLERSGMALRGYTKNAWAKGEELPSGKIAPVTMVGRGHSVRWILIADRPEVRGAGGLECETGVGSGVRSGLVEAETKEEKY